MLTLRHILVGSVLAGLLSSSPAAAQTADNFLGTWKLNIAQSKFAGAPYKSLTVTFEKAGAGGVKITAIGTAGDGSAINTVYSPTYDGKDVPVTGSPDYDAAALKMLDANTRHTVRKLKGKEVQTLHSVVSKDGKHFTSTTTGVNAKGEKANSTFVFDKQ